MTPLSSGTESALDRRLTQIDNKFYRDLCCREIGVILDGWIVGSVLADRDLINIKLLEARRSGVISREEYLDGLRPDIIAHGVEDTAHAGPFAVVEVSLTFDRRDLENAACRAAVIAKVIGSSVAAFVATHSAWPDEVAPIADGLGVTIIRHEDPDYDRGEEIYDSLSGLAQTERPDGQL